MRACLRAAVPVLLLVLLAFAARAADVASTPDLLPVGAAAPQFSVVAHDGHKVDLARLKGRYVVL